jgi:hypothetical protein
MGWLRDIIENRKKNWHKNAIKFAKEEATRLFQIGEHNSLLWLIYDGHLIAPFAMLCNGDDANECVALINTIRDLYVKRITDGNER